MNKKIVILSMVTIGIISFYMYFTRPIGLNAMIGVESIEDITAIDIDIYTRRNLGSSKERLVINEMKDIHEWARILDNYRYCKKFNAKNLIPGDSTMIQGKTSSFIQTFITCGKGANKMGQRQFTIDDNNTITITYTPDNHWESEYRVSGSEGRIFEDLSSRLGEILSPKGE